MSGESVLLPNNWVLTSIGEIYRIVGGGTPATTVHEYWEGTYPWISSADIYGLKEIQPRKFITEEAVNNSATNIVPEGSLIVVTRVGLGKVALAPYPICFSQDSQALIGNNDLVNPKYSLYYLSQAVQSFKYKHRGTTIAGVPKSQLGELAFPLPPLDEQVRIVSKIEELFSRLNAGVKALQQTQQQLEQYKQSVINQVFEKVIENTDRCKWIRIGDFFKVSGGGTPVRNKLEYWNGSIPWVSSGEVNFNLINKTNEHITEIGLHNSSAKILPKNTVLIALYGDGKTRGRAALLNIEATTNQAIAAIDCSSSKQIPGYVYWWFVKNYFTIRKRSEGTNQKNLYLHHIKDVTIPLPEIHVQKNVVNTIEEYNSLITSTLINVNYLFNKTALLKNSILKMAFEGKLTSQNSNDESASVLIEKIRAETAAIGKPSSRGRKSKNQMSVIV